MESGTGSNSTHASIAAQAGGGLLWAASSGGALVISPGGGCWNGGMCCHRRRGVQRRWRCDGGTVVDAEGSVMGCARRLMRRVSLLGRTTVDLTRRQARAPAPARRALWASLAAAAKSHARSDAASSCCRTAQTHVCPALGVGHPRAPVQHTRQLVGDVSGVGVREIGDSRIRLLSGAPYIPSVFGMRTWSLVQRERERQRIASGGA